MAGRPRTRAKREAQEAARAAAASGIAPTVIMGSGGAAPGASARNLMSREEFEADRRKPHVVYSEELALEVCVGIACGVSMVALCEMPDMPSRRSIYYWRRDHPEFAKALEDALKFRADGRLNMIDSLIEAVTGGQIDPIAVRVALDGHKWLAGKENFKYSDVQRVEMTGKDGGPLSILDAGPAEAKEVARFYALVISRGERAARQLELQQGEFSEVTDAGQ